MQQPLVHPSNNKEDQAFLDLIEFFNETLGFCPNSVKTMYHRPAIAYAFINLNKAVMENNGNVSSALKRLIGYVSSNVAGCRYCQAHTIEQLKDMEQVMSNYKMFGSIKHIQVLMKLKELH